MVSKKLMVILVFAIAFFGILSTAHADLGNIKYSVNVINDKARPGEKLEYNVTLRNDGTSPIKLSLNVLFTGITEVKPSVFTLDPGAEQLVHVALTVKSDQKPGRILIKLLVFDDAGNSLDPPIYLQGEILESPKLFESVKINKVEVEPKVLDPRNPFSIKFEVYNPIKTVVVPLEVTSDIEGFSYRIENQTVSEGTNTITISNLTLPPDAAPGNHTFTVRLLFFGGVVSEGSTVAGVVSYSNCVIDERTDVSLIGKTYTASVKNTGTEEANCVVSSQVTGIEKALVTSITEGYAYEDGQFVWKLNISPGSEVIVKYNISYVPILAIPFIVIAAVAAIWYLTRKVTIKKELVDYKRYPGFMDLKIQLKVRNLTNNELRNVKVSDMLPAFVKEVRDYGTIPGEVKKKGKSKMVVWEIESIKPREERVLSYKIRTSLEVLGNITFAPAKVEFKDINGNKVEEFSNTLSLEVE